MADDSAAKVVELQRQPSRWRLDVADGKPGLKSASGYLYEEFLPQLRGPRGMRVYQEMSSNHPVIAGFMFAITSILAGVDWHAEPENAKKAEDKAASDFIDSCLRDMADTWSDALSEILSMLTFGWHYAEVVWKQRNGRNPEDPLLSSKFDDGKWGWQQFAPRGQTSLSHWEIDDSGRILGMWQQAPEDTETRLLSLRRGLLFRLMPKKNSPEGSSLLRGCYRPWFFQKRLQELEAIGVERNLAGLPVMYVDPKLFDSEDASMAAQLQTWKKVVRNLKRDEQEGVILPTVRDESGNKLYELTLLSTGSRRQSDTNALIQRHNAEIAMAALSDFMLLGHSRVGTFALGVTKTDFFATAYSYVLDIIANEINEREIPRLLGINAMPGEARLVHGKPGNVDIEKFSQMVLRLYQAGLPMVSEDGERERFIFEQLGLPSGDVGSGATPVKPPEATTPKPPPSAAVAKQALALASPPFEFGTTQLNLQGEDAAAVLAIDLPDGCERETCPHITVRYGVANDALPEDLAPKLASFGAIEIVVDGYRVFEPEGEGQVPVLTVASERLSDLRALVETACDCAEATYDFRPHITLGVAASGLAKQPDVSSLIGRSMSFDTLVFSAKDGTVSSLPLVAS